METLSKNTIWLLMCTLYNTLGKLDWTAAFYICPVHSRFTMVIILQSVFLLDWCMFCEIILWDSNTRRGWEVCLGERWSEDQAELLHDCRTRSCPAPDQTWCPLPLKLFLCMRWEQIMIWLKTCNCAIRTSTGLPFTLAKWSPTNITTFVHNICP